jgi:REP element-mobilizing transposase RayT
MSQFDYKHSYRRNLPHLQPRGVTLFVTFRLTGSLPKPVIEQWRNERTWLEHLKQTNPVYFDQVNQHFERAWFAKFEDVLDGSCCGPLWLSDEKVANQVADSLHYRDGKVYRLDAFSIMPNHSHILFKPLPIDNSPSMETAYHSLASIMQSLKGFTAHACNRLLDREGHFWAHESYDHYVRNHEEWLRIVSYILNNPVKAGYVDDWRKWKWNYKRECSLINQTAN